MTTSSDAPAVPPVRRHHGLVRLTHWLNAVFLVGMIGSGLQIWVIAPWPFTTRP